jgi:hypothetical protein
VHECGRFLESPLSGLGPTKRGIPGAVGKEEALLMSVNKEVGLQARDYSRCQIAHLPGKSPSSSSSSSCAEAAREEVDGLLLCERHALESKLEGQIECWEEMLFHIELWSREARRRQRQDVVGLLEDQRTQAISASHRAYDDLDVLRRSQTPLGEVLSDGAQLLSSVRRETLPLPPKDARPPFVGLRRLRRR